MGETMVRYRSVIADSARWEGFSFRPDDIVISTPWKCGTTWTQMICALLVFQTPELDQPLDLIAPWVDIQTRTKEDLFADLEAQRHRRFIKTHTPLDGLPFDESVVYLCVGRDPRDVGFSWGNHMANIDFPAFFKAREEAVGLDDVPELMPDGPPVIPDDELDRFWMWADDPTPPPAALGNLRATVHHLTDFWEARDGSNIVLLHYDDLKADLEGEMRSLAARLGIQVPEERWPVLVQAATFGQMRGRAAELAPEVHHGVWLDNQRFFNRGTSGHWQTLLDDVGHKRYGDRVAELITDPDLSAWMHRGGNPG